jgi:hypothetical protein
MFNGLMNNPVECFDPDFWQIGIASVAALPAIKWSFLWFMYKAAHNDSMNTVMPLYQQVVCSKTYCGYVKLQIISNTMCNMIVV